MKRVLKREYIAILLCIAIGMFLHFAYELCAQNAIVGIFSAVNESMWEHLKIAFWPEIGFLAVYFFIKKPSFVKEIVAGAWLLFTTFLIMTTFYYTYTGIIGNHFLSIDIAIFVLAIVFGFYMFFGLMKEAKKNSLPSIIISCILVFALLIAICCFTKWPPNLGIFEIPFEAGSF